MEEDEKDEKMNIFKNFETKTKISKQAQSTEEDKLEQERKKYKIYYKIIKNMNIPYLMTDKNSLDGTIDEIISRQLIKIHNKDYEKNRRKIGKIYEIFQSEKIQNCNNRLTNYNVYSNINQPDYNSDDMNKINKIKKSKSAGKIIRKKRNNSKIKNIERLRDYDEENLY